MGTKKKQTDETDFNALDRLARSITLEPKLLQAADAYARKAGLSRSQLFSDALRQRIEST